MITFILSLAALVLGYIFYGLFVERVFGPDDRVTPAVSKADGLDYIVMAAVWFTIWYNKQERNQQ